MKTCPADRRGRCWPAPSARAADAPDDGGPAVVPYRPSVSTPAQLSAPGYLELEAGGLRATGPDSGSSRTTLPYTLKLAFTPDWGIRVGGDAWVRQAAPGEHATAACGDTSVVLKRRFAVSDATAWGLELGEKFPTAGSTLRQRPRRHHRQRHLQQRLRAGLAHRHQPQRDAPGRAVGPAARLAGRLGRGGLAHAHRRLGRGRRVLRHAPGRHAPAPRSSWPRPAGTQSPAAVFDFGAARGLNDASPRWQVFAGVTVRLAKLF